MTRDLSDFNQGGTYDGVQLVDLGYGTFQEPETIVEEAVRITSTDRNDDYGPPEDDLANIGRCWAATLTAHYRTPCADLPASVVALLMIQLKVIREAHVSKRDNRVDVIGYAICAQKACE